MTPIGLTVPDDLRASLRRRFAGMPGPVAEAADELADLAVHAIGEALTAIDRTAARTTSVEAQLAVILPTLVELGNCGKSIRTEMALAVLEVIAAKAGHGGGK
ncbi:MAG TPA: hypothetical protein PKD99_02425 [Sphingopyxis sp.]|nr:hypothetical protein [Sphingopyxis sp.]HMP43933.1 hypothetical protein [Sphingopyxis sp.]HMQ20030.1 hypothetical protein [Sphingopyxis sp.]